MKEIVQTELGNGVVLFYTNTNKSATVGGFENLNYTNCSVLTVTFSVYVGHMSHPVFGDKLSTCLCNDTFVSVWVRRI